MMAGITTYEKSCKKNSNSVTISNTITTIHKQLLTSSKHVLLYMFNIRNPLVVIR